MRFPSPPQNLGVLHTGCQSAAKVATRHWEGELDKDHTRTLYVSMLIQESKVKPRKGKDFGWRKVPQSLQHQVTTHTIDLIVDIEDDRAAWQQMAGVRNKDPNTNLRTTESAKQSRFVALSEEEELETQE